MLFRLQIRSMVLSGLCLLPLWVACAESARENQLSRKAEFQAAPVISDSFVLAQAQTLRKKQDHKGKNHTKNKQNSPSVPASTESLNLSFLDANSSSELGIRKTALDKEFLLRANYIEGGLAPKFQSLKTRVVAFAKKGRDLFLIEASEGHAYYKELPQQLILAKFPIILEKDDSLYFDFNAGMNKLYMMEDWYSQDFSGSEHPGPSEQFKAVGLEASFIETMNLGPEPDVLYIRQVAQLNDASKGLIPAEIRYYLQPYSQNPGFVAVPSPANKDDYAFFEVSPRIAAGDGQAQTLASRFDHRKPLTFAISANTPEAYRAAITEGLLYWNKAFGREVIKVILAPAEETAPSYRYNLVQWIDWDEAAFAYADAQMDPRSGEILNAQIYLSSVFAVSSEQRARELLRRLDVKAEASASSLDRATLAAKLAKPGAQATELLEALSPSLSRTRAFGEPSAAGTAKSLSATRLCHRPALPAAYTQALVGLVGRGVKPQAYQKVAQDYVRATVAHEVGHTLGLRHNFAGVRSSTLPVERRQEALASYLETASVPPELVVTSSVMDYLPFEETILAGAQLKNAQQAFAYDDMAIKILYEGLDPDSVADRPLFCTDSHLDEYADCRVWNVGGSPLAAAKVLLADNLQSLPYQFAEYFIANSKAPPQFAKASPFTSLRLSPYRLALQLLEPRARALEALQGGKRALWIERNLGFEGNLKARWSNFYGGPGLVVAESFAQWVHQDLQEVGEGRWEAILDQVPADLGAKVTAEFYRLITSPAYRRGVGPGGQYEFTAAEIASMQAAVAGFMYGLEKALLIVDLLQLAEVDKISAAEVSEPYAQLDEAFTSYLAAKAHNVIFALEDSAEEDGQVQTQAAWLSVAAKAELKAATKGGLLEKLIALKQFMQEYGEIKLRFDDQEPTRAYSPAELSELASHLLEAQLAELLAVNRSASPAASGLEASSSRSESASESSAASSTDSFVSAAEEETMEVVTEDTGVSADVLERTDRDRAAARHEPWLAQRQVSEQRLWNALVAELSATGSELGGAQGLRTYSDTASVEGAGPVAATAAYGLKIPVTVQLKVKLPQFRHNYLLRCLAALLLEAKRGESLAYGMQERNELRSNLSMLLQMVLRGENLALENLGKQDKRISVWVQENFKVLGSLGKY